MKFIDILFLLTAAATANAILIPTDNNGSPKASDTSSQVSGSTNEPNPVTSNEYQQEPMDLSTHNQNQQQPMDLSLPNRIQQQPMDQPNTNTPSQNHRPTVIVAGPNISKQGRKRPIDVIDLTTSDKDQQDPTDVAGPSTSKQGRKQPIDQPSPSTSSQIQQHPMNQPSPNTSGRYWKLMMNEISSRTPEDWQKTIDAVVSKNYDQDQQQPIDRAGPSTSSQYQQQPMTHGNSANAGSNQATGLNKKFQRTLDGMIKRLVLFKKMAKQKHQEYYTYANIRLGQQSALSRGEEISESRHTLEVEDQLKQEFRKLSTKASSIRQDLKRFMRKHSLKFEEPESDSD
ncbi:hypothetical protein BDV3_002044 [Batrachochytrium dendrobatidis]|nr:hypothetical protein QVD99_008404 [Batrachochytrium dendrobatidis]